MKQRNDLGQFTPEIGIKSGQSPISTKYPEEIEKILRSLPNRSEKIRQWVIEGMRKEGLLGEE
ncbi:hypothetical protein LC593_10655 [Nostoc sp. CHAB 5844]|nr:hypothetical protein [Nostoc sp. CHAB 5844]